MEIIGLWTCASQHISECCSELSELECMITIIQEQGRTTTTRNNTRAAFSMTISEILTFEIGALSDATQLYNTIFICLLAPKSQSTYKRYRALKTLLHQSFAATLQTISIDFQRRSVPRWYFGSGFNSFWQLVTRPWVDGLLISTRRLMIARSILRHHFGQTNAAMLSLPTVLAPSVLSILSDIKMRMVCLALSKNSSEQRPATKCRMLHSHSSSFLPRV